MHTLNVCIWLSFPLYLQDAAACVSVCWKSAVGSPRGLVQPPGFLCQSQEAGGAQTQLKHPALLFSAFQV